jgi:predicted nuclease of predicted toxin-antitoxin system
VSLPLLMDAHVHGDITRALQDRGIDVLTAQADGSDELADPDLLDRALALGRVLVTYDKDFLVIAHDRQSRGFDFPGSSACRFSASL